jgi:hypothetical protein
MRKCLGKNEDFAGNQPAVNDRLEDLVAVISYVDDEFRVKNSVVNRSGDC